MPKAEAIAIKVAIVKSCLTFPSPSAPSSNMLATERIVCKSCSLWLNFLEDKLTYLSLIRCSCYYHTVIFISGNIWEKSFLQVLTLNRKSAYRKIFLLPSPFFFWRYNLKDSVQTSICWFYWAMNSISTGIFLSKSGQLSKFWQFSWEQ